nr:neuropeptide-like 3 [Onthophagus taurus]
MFKAIVFAAILAFAVAAPEPKPKPGLFAPAVVSPVVSAYSAPYVASYPSYSSPLVSAYSPYAYAAYPYAYDYPYYY